MNFSCASSCPSTFWSFMYGSISYAALSEGIVDALLEFCKPIMPPKMYITFFLFLYGLKMAISAISKQSKMALSYCVTSCTTLFTLWWNKDEEVVIKEAVDLKKKSSNDKNEDKDSFSSFEDDDDNNLSDDEESSDNDEEIKEKEEIKPSTVFCTTMRRPRNFDKELNSTF